MRLVSVYKMEKLLPIISMLRLKNIKKSIKEKTIVNDISFDVPLGAINGLLGPNGAGKTTTFYIIAGLMKCDQGKVIFNNVDISKLSMHKRSKLGIKYLPQEPSIFLNLSVYENLLGLAEISIPKKQDIDIFIEKSIDEFNLSKILDLKGTKSFEEVLERVVIFQNN